FVFAFAWGWWVVRRVQGRYVFHATATGILATLIYLGLCLMNPDGGIRAVVAMYGLSFFIFGNLLRIFRLCSGWLCVPGSKEGLTPDKSASGSLRPSHLSRSRYPGQVQREKAEESPGGIKINFAVGCVNSLSESECRPQSVFPLVRRLLGLGLRLEHCAEPLNTNVSRLKDIQIRVPRRRREACVELGLLATASFWSSFFSETLQYSFRALSSACCNRSSNCWCR